MSPTQRNNVYDLGLRTTWILVAHRAGAKLFESRGRGRSVETVIEVDNPSGRLKVSEQVSDRPGRTFSSAGSERHAYSPDEGFLEHKTLGFARELCALIEKGRVTNRFDDLVLVAGPDLLGKLRECLSRSATEQLVATLPKDLPMLDERGLREHLEGVLRI